MKKACLQFKRTLSLVLAAMMVFTAIPQTATVVMADEVAVATETVDESVIADDVVVDESVEEVVAGEIPAADLTLTEEVAAVQNDGTVDSALSDADVVEAEEYESQYNIHIDGLVVKEKREGVDELIDIPFSANEDGKSGVYISNDGKGRVSLTVNSFIEDTYYLLAEGDNWNDSDKYYPASVYLGEVAPENEIKPQSLGSHEYTVKKSDLEGGKTLIITSKKAVNDKVKLTVKHPDNDKVTVKLCEFYWENEEDEEEKIRETVIPEEGLLIESVSYCHIKFDANNIKPSDYEMYANGVRQYFYSDDRMGNCVTMITVEDSDIVISYEKVDSNPAIFASKKTVTFDPLNGKFSAAGINAESTNPYIVDKNDLSKPISYHYFAVQEKCDGKLHYTGQYGYCVRNWNNIDPIPNDKSKKFVGWYEKDEEGNPDLSKPLIWKYRDKIEVKDITYVAQYAPILPKVDITEYIKTSDSLSFVANVPESLKELYDPATQALKYQFSFGTYEVPNTINYDNPEYGWYMAWNGADVDFSNSTQTVVVPDAESLPKLFKTPVPDETIVDISVRYVVVNKSEDNPRNFINFNRMDSKYNVVNYGDYPVAERLIFTPDSYSVTVSNQSPNMSYVLNSDSEYFIKRRSYSDTYLVGTAGSKGVKLIVTAKNARVPEIKIGSSYDAVSPLEGVTPTVDTISGAKKYTYVIPNDKLPETDVNGKNYIVIEEQDIIHTVNVTVDKKNVVIDKARIGSLNYNLTPENETADGYQIKVTNGDTLTLDFVAKKNCLISKVTVGSKVDSKGKNKTSYTNSVTPKGNEEKTVSVTVDSKAKDVVTVTNGDSVVKEDKNKVRGVEYGVEYVLTYSKGNSDADDSYGDAISDVKFELGSVDITPYITKALDDNKLSFTIPATYPAEGEEKNIAGKKVKLTAKSGEYEIKADLSVKAVVNKIKSINGKSYKENFAVSQAMDSVATYKLVTTPSTASMSDLSVSVSGNGIASAEIDDKGVITVTTNPVKTEEAPDNIVTVSRKDGTEVGKFNVNIAAPKMAYKLTKASADVTNIYLTFERDKSVKKPESDKIQLFYVVDMSMAHGFPGAVEAANGEFKRRDLYPVDFDEKTQNISIEVETPAHGADAKFTVKTYMEALRNVSVSEGDYRWIYDGELIARTKDDKKHNKTLVCKASKTQVNKLQFNKKLDKVNNYISANAVTEYLVATPKWEKNVTYKSLARAVKIMKKVDASEVDADPSLIEAYTDGVGKVFVKLNGKAAAGTYKLYVTPNTVNGGPVPNEAATGVYTVTVVDSTFTMPTVKYPVTVLKPNNKAVKVKASVKIPKGYKVSYAISENSISSNKIKVDAKSGQLSVAKDYVLRAERETIQINATIKDSSGNVIDSSVTDVALIANSPKFGRLVAVVDTGVQYKVVRDSLKVGQTYKFIVVKYGTIEKDAYAYPEALENVTITSADAKSLKAQNGDEAKALKAKSSVKITAKSGDGSKQSISAKFKVVK